MTHLLAHSITKLPADPAGAVVICGSHGGLYPGYVAAKAALRAVIFNDAGIGRDEAGVASLGYLAALGMAAATVAHDSCRIGDAADMERRGRISRANALAADLGIIAGMACAAAAARLAAAPLPHGTAPPVAEGRQVVDAPDQIRRLVLIDSAAMVEPADIGQIVVTGSHGGLVGGVARMALQVDGFAAVFNDAGIGPDAVGLARLPALDERGIAAITVAHSSARIGEAMSSYRDGVISAVNRAAADLGAVLGAPACGFLDTLARGSH